MNPSRRLIIQMAAVSAATFGLESLHPANAATTLPGSRTQELSRLSRAVRSHTASRSATIAFANEIRANRDEAIKRLMGPTLAGRLAGLPLSTRATVGNLVFDVVGNELSPALNVSGAQVDALSYALGGVMAFAGVFILGAFYPTTAPSLPPNHPCYMKELAMLAAADLAINANRKYQECRDKLDAPSVGSNLNVAIFVTTDTDSDGIPPASEQDSCDDEWEYLLDRSDVYLRACDQFNACMSG